MRPALPSGLTARFTHLRHPVGISGTMKIAWPVLLLSGRELREQGYAISPVGGVTVCNIVNEAGESVAGGVAKCCDRDNFNKRIGRDISLGRALKNLHSSVEEASS